MLKMNLITQNELCREVDRELYRELGWEVWSELYRELYRELGEEVRWGLGYQIRADFSHSKISRV